MPSLDLRYSEPHEFPPFGAAMRTDFALAPHFAHLNHGARRAAARRAPCPGRPASPDGGRTQQIFERDFLEPEMRAAAGALADYLSTDVDGLALIENATIVSTRCCVTLISPQ